MVQLKKLFQPGRIGALEVRNRIIMAPMASCGADEKSYPTARMMDYYAARAKGGVGLIIAGVCMVMPGRRSPYQLALDDDKFIPHLQRLTKAVHAHGAKVAIQFNHLGKALLSPRFGNSEERRKRALAPSAIPLVAGGAVPREATAEDIQSIQEAMAQASRRAREAGFDAVEIHAAHGYLFSDFLSPAANQRTDAYGGNPQNRARLACETIRRIREIAGADFPIGIRFSGCDYLEGGITLQDTMIQAPMFVEAGADVLHVSASSVDTLQYQFLPYLLPDGMIVNLAEAIKKVANVPVITVGKLGDPVLANQVIEDGKADFVAMGRPLLADPELPNKAREGRLDEITRCLSCNSCWSMPESKKREFGGLNCCLNPYLYREAESLLKATDSPRKVLVIGGGIAGMEAARVLAERRHQVTLYERSDKLGGQWNIVKQQESKEVHATVTDRLSRGLQKSGAKVILNMEATAQLVRDERASVVVMATGAEPLTPDIRGVHRRNVVQANDVIAGEVEVGDRVVVIGGSLIGMEVAASLAGQGKKVSLVTRGRVGGSREPLPDTNTLRVLMGRFIEHAVCVYPYTLVSEITDSGIYIDYDRHLLRGLLFLGADTIVLAVGSSTRTRLAEEIKDLVPELYRIGDCVEPRSAMEAIREGAEIARQI